MGANSNIEWTDHTFNPWIGCTKVSPGCAHCYAEQLMAVRYQRVEWGKGKARVRTSPANWKKPLAWNMHAARCRVIDGLVWDGALRSQIVNQPETLVVMATSGDRKLSMPIAAWDAAKQYRPRVFCASLADWLDNEVSLAMFGDLLELIFRCQYLDWLLLTKRPQLWKDRLASFVNLELSYRTASEQNASFVAWLMAWLNGTAPANVWVGTTAEDQERAEERVPQLLNIPARVRFLSCEPLLGAIDLTRLDVGEVCRECCQPVSGDAFAAAVECGCCTEGSEPVTWGALHWVICGGESGGGARPMLVEWADDLRRQCGNADVPFFMKQLGAHVGTTNANAHDWPDHIRFEEVLESPQVAGARVKLRSAKGGDFEEFPAELQIRQFPNVQR